MNRESVVHFLNFHPPLFMYGDYTCLQTFLSVSEDWMSVT